MHIHTHTDIHALLTETTVCMCVLVRVWMGGAHRALLVLEARQHLADVPEVRGAHGREQGLACQSMGRFRR